jgi:hypothetical protein
MRWYRKKIECWILFKICLTWKYTRILSKCKCHFISHIQIWNFTRYRLESRYFIHEWIWPSKFSSSFDSWSDLTGPKWIHLFGKYTCRSFMYKRRLFSTKKYENWHCFSNKVVYLSCQNTSYWLLLIEIQLSGTATKNDIIRVYIQFESESIHV